MVEKRLSVNATIPNQLERPTFGCSPETWLSGCDFDVLAAFSLMPRLTRKAKGFVKHLADAFPVAWMWSGGHTWFPD